MNCKCLGCTSGIYYKRLIRENGLWKSPKDTAKIIREAASYHHKPFWKDIAVDIGISKTTISRIVTGKLFPSQATMVKLIKYLDLTV